MCVKRGRTNWDSGLLSRGEIFRDGNVGLLFSLEGKEYYSRIREFYGGVNLKVFWKSNLR
jgi:hypothetical protein